MAERFTPSRGMEVNIDENAAELEPAILANRSREMDYFAAYVMNQFFDIANKKSNPRNADTGAYARSVTFMRLTGRQDRFIYTEEENGADLAIEVGKKKWKSPDRRRTRRERKANNKLRASLRDTRKGQKGKFVWEQLMAKEF